MERQKDRWTDTRIDKDRWTYTWIDRKIDGQIHGYIDR